MRARVAVAAVVLVTAGCESRLEPAVSQLASQVADLQKQVDQLKTVRQPDELNAIKWRISSLENSRDQYNFARFDPSEDRAYQRVDTVLGPVLVVLDDVQPFADGSRIKLRVGNIAAAQIGSIKMGVKWHEKMPELSDDPIDEDRSRHGEALVAWSSGKGPRMSI